MAINKNKIAQFIGYVDVAKEGESCYTRLGCTNDVVFTFNNAANETVIDTDSCGEILKVVEAEATIEGTFYESFDIDTMELLLGGSKTSVTGAAVSGATQEFGSPIEYGVFCELDGQNADGSAPTITSVVGSVDGALTAGTDYNVVENSTKGTRYGVSFVSGGNITTVDQTITVTYDYTPNAAEVLELTAGVVTLPEFSVRVIALDPNDENKVKFIKLAKATFTSEYGIQFVNAVRAGGLDGTSFKFTSVKGSKVDFHDEML